MQSFKRALPYLWMAGTLLFLVIYLELNIDDLIDYDASSELVLAKLLSEEGGVLSENWYYSTELRVLNTQLVFAPLFLLFSDWHAVRMVGTVILYLIYLLCIYYFCRQGNLKSSFPLIAGVFFLPLSDIYFCYVLGHVYYIPHICISLAMLGMLFAFSRAEKPLVRIALVLVATVLSVLAGMGGLRQLLVLYVPIALCALVELALYLRPLIFSKGEEEAPETALDIPTSESLSSRQRLRFSLLSLWSALMSVVGYLIDSKVLSTIYSYTTYEGLSFSAFSLDNVITVLNGFLYCLGYRTGKEVFSKWLLVNALAVALALLIVVATWDCLKNAKKYPWETRMVALFFVFAVIAFVGVYSFTNMMDTRWRERYCLPILVFAIPVVASYLSRVGASIRVPRVKGIATLSLCVALSLGAAVNYYMAVSQGYIQRAMSSSTSELGEIATMLTEAGYTQGYGTRGQANILTELSDGTLDVIQITESTTTDFSSIDPWLQLKAHDTVIPEGKIFCIFSTAQQTSYEVVLTLSADHIIYQSDNYVVYSYNSYESLMEDVNDG